MRKVIFASITFVMLATLVTAWWILGLPMPIDAQDILATSDLNTSRTTWRPIQNAAGSLTASGHIEADTVEIAAEITGRVRQIPVEEGDVVDIGQPLVTMDNAMLASRRRVAEAALQIAEANLALVQAGIRSGEIAQAEAGVSLAVAARNAAEQSYQDAVAARANMQQLDLSIIETEGQLAALQAKVTEQEAASRAAQLQYDFLGRRVYDTRVVVDDGVRVSIDVPGVGQVSRRIRAGESLLQQPNYLWNISGQDLSVAYENLNAVRSARDGAQTNLANLMAIRANPLTVNSTVYEAQAQLDVTEALVATAQAQVELLRAGPSEAQVQAATAQVQEAQANLDFLDAQMYKKTVTAPLNAIVTERVVDEGEMAFPGSALLTLADLSRLTLIVYVPEEQLSQAQIGAQVTVRVDPYPQRTFPGKVIYVAPHLAFTPANVQTQEERARNVVAVKIAMDNPDLLLKPGMPADAWF